MSKFFRSVKNVFTRKRPDQDENQLSDFDYQPTENAYKRKPYQPPQNRLDSNENMEDLNYADPSQRSYRSRQSEIPTDDESETPSLVPPNRPSSEVRYEAADVQTNSSRSNGNRRSTNRPSNNATIPTTRTTPQQNPDSLIQNQIPPVRPPPPNPMPQQPVNDIPNRTMTEPQSNPSTNQIPQSSLIDSFIAFLNQNRQPFQTNPNSTLVGFPGSAQQRNRNQPSSFDRFRHLKPPFRSSFTPRPPQFSSRNDVSNYEIDYPIENVLINGNVSQSMAIKINEAVERDRFGNAYRRERYAYEPTVQQINIDNYPRMQRRVVENTNRPGTRYIREITNNNIYPQNLYRQPYRKENYDTIPLMADDIPQTDYSMMYSQIGYNAFPTPIQHYVAQALPNDPMRIY